MSIEDIAKIVEQKANENPNLGAKIKFNLGDDGIIFLDATGAKPVVNHDDNEADATITMKAKNFEKLLEGSLDPTFAFMTGKLKVKGSMGVAMKLNSMLGD